MSVNILSFKTVSCLWVASLMFALGALQAFEESELEMRKKHAGCDDHAARKCRQCPTGPRGPIGPQGPTGAAAAFVSGYSSGFAATGTSQPVLVNPGRTTVNLSVDVVNPPVGIAHAGNSYVIGVTGVYSLSFIVNFANLLGFPAEVVAVIINISGNEFTSTPDTILPFSAITVSGTYNVPLVAGNVITLQTSAALASNVTVTGAALSLTKISQP